MNSACPTDNNGDGNCGRRTCPVCYPRHSVQEYIDAVEARIKELGWKEALRRLDGDSESHCEECEGSGKRGFYECDELLDCVDCNGTGKVSLASESQREAAESADGKPDDQAENARALAQPGAQDSPNTTNDL